MRVVIVHECGRGIPPSISGAGASDDPPQRPPIKPKHASGTHLAPVAPGERILNEAQLSSLANRLARATNIAEYMAIAADSRGNDSDDRAARARVDAGVNPFGSVPPARSRAP